MCQRSEGVVVGCHRPNCYYRFRLEVKLEASCQVNCFTKLRSCHVQHRFDLLSFDDTHSAPFELPVDASPKRLRRLQVGIKLQVVTAGPNLIHLGNGVLWEGLVWILHLLTWISCRAKGLQADLNRARMMRLFFSPFVWSRCSPRERSQAVVSIIYTKSSKVTTWW